jgi:hypothetical protein
MTHQHTRITGVLFAFCVCLALPSLAYAAEPTVPSTPTTAPSNPELARASAVLEQAAEIAHANRSSTIAIGLTSSAVLMPTGVVLLVRGGDVPHIIGTGLTATAGGALFTTFLSLHTSGAERFYDTFRERRAAGMPETELLTRTETEWSALARATAESRRTAGTVETVMGGTFAVAGVFFLLAPQLGNLPQRSQYSIGAILTGTGIPFLSLGLHTLFLKSPVETSWNAYRAGKPSATTANQLDLSFAPLAGGGSLLAGMAF